MKVRFDLFELIGRNIRIACEHECCDQARYLTIDVDNNTLDYACSRHRTKRVFSEKFRTKKVTAIVEREA